MTADLHPGLAERALALGAAACLLHGTPGIGRQGVAARAAAAHVGADGGAGVNPDIRRLVGTDGKPATAEDARAFVAALRLSGERGMRAGIVPEVDRLNEKAAAALLKLVEEPAAGTRIFLTASSPASLGPALLSRCTRLRVPHPDFTRAEAWLAAQLPDAEPEIRSRLLALAEGAPGRALDLHREDALHHHDGACRLLAPIARGHSAIDPKRLDTLATDAGDVTLAALVRLLERAARHAAGARLSPAIAGEDKLLDALARRVTAGRLAAAWRCASRIHSDRERAHLDASRALLRAGHQVNRHLAG